MRGLLSPGRRRGNPLLHHAHRSAGGQGGHHGRGPSRPLGQATQAFRQGGRRNPAPRSASLGRRAGAAMRDLPVRHDDQGDRTARGQPLANRRRHQGRPDHLGALAASVSVRQLCGDPRGRPPRRPVAAPTARRPDRRWRSVRDRYQAEKISRSVCEQVLPGPLRQVGRLPDEHSPPRSSCRPLPLR